MAAELDLSIRDSISKEMLDCDARNLYRLLPSPTLFDLSNGNTPIFVSVLLHGDETTGWDAVRQFIRERDLSHPKNSLLLYVGNVQAAAVNQRFLDHQLDFNRIWCGGKRTEHRHAEQVVEVIRKLEPRFALDIHNNSGLNPAYSVLTHSSYACLTHAREFSSIALLAPSLHSVITRRMNEICPSITIEVGLSGQFDSLDRTLKYLDYLFNTDLDHVSFPEDLAVYRTVANLRVETEGKPHFPSFPKLNPALEPLNFDSVPAGTSISTNLNDDWVVRVYDNNDVEQTSKYLEQIGKDTYLKNDVIVAMFTQHVESAFQDCVCYFLEPTTVRYGDDELLQPIPE